MEKIIEWLKQFFANRPVAHPKEVGQFKNIPRQFTQSPVKVPYYHFAHGYRRDFSDISVAQERPPIHYYRFRPFLGRNDPVLLSGGVRNAERLSQRLLSQEKRAVERQLWKDLFALPPTHVVRFGWKSQITGNHYEILYIPLCFRRLGFSTDYLAHEFSDVLFDWIERAEISAVVPPHSKLLSAQEFILIWGFIHYRYLVIDKPLERHR